MINDLFHNIKILNYPPPAGHTWATKYESSQIASNEVMMWIFPRSFFIFAMIAMMIAQAYAFQSLRFSRTATTSPRLLETMLNLDMVEIRLPLQSNTAQYAELLYQRIPRDSVLRWYIASIADGQAILEVVVTDEHK